MVYTSALLRRPGLLHGFTSASGPDLGRQASAADWAEAARLVGLPGAGVARASQVHGREVLVAAAPGLVGEGDALITEVPGLLVAVRVADCVPILVAGEGFVAAIHAGWRGIAQNIVGAALAGRRGRWAVVGPCISPDSYEVGDEVIAGIADAGVPAAVFVRQGARRAHADLRAAAVWQLHAAGVTDVDVLDVCTFKDPVLHSHRRDGAAAGRQAGLIGMAP